MITIKTTQSRFVYFFLACAIFTAIMLHPLSAKANSRYASIVIDADTGAIISQSHADRVLHPASLTKMMTMLMAFEALERREISLNDKIRISDHAASMQPSKLDLPVGSTIRVEDALKALAVKSANDIAVAMAEFLGGSESTFARKMTAKAQSIGMSQTRFTNASGLHDPRQVSSARDMARLSRYLIERHPGFYHYFSMKSFTYRGKTYGTHNHLMKSYAGMDGLKTGYILASGFNLAASAKRNNRRLIGVVFGGRTSQSRNAHMKLLLDRGFAAIGKNNAPQYKVIQMPDPAPQITNHVMAANVPVPPQKPLYNPGQDIMAQTIAQLEPAAGAAILSRTQEKIIDAITTTLNNRQESAVAQRLGQGDIDDDSAIRFQTGLMAIAAHTHREYSIEGIGNFGGSQARAKLYKTNVSHVQEASNRANWAVQLGAYKSRSQTDQRLRQAYNNLPTELRYGSSVIIPVRVNNTILFRGRLSGYTKEHAGSICELVSDCIVVEPQ